MRDCPKYILELVRGYDRNLSVEWDGNDAVWYLVDRGERLFSLDHLDGTPIRNIDGCGAEVLEVIRRADVGRTGKAAFRRRLRTSRRDMQYLAEGKRNRIKDEATGEAREIARWMKHGHSPRSGAAFAGVSKR